MVNLLFSINCTLEEALKCLLEYKNMSPALKSEQKEAISTLALGLALYFTCWFCMKEIMTGKPSSVVVLVCLSHRLPKL